MSPTPIPETVTVSATVLTKAETDRGMTIGLDIPSFNSKFPVLIYSVDPETANEVTIKQAVNVSLKRGNLKKEKKGEFWTDYFWNWAGVGAPSAPTTAPKEQAALAPQGAPEARDGTRVSIERQKALAEAITAYRDYQTQNPSSTQAKSMMETATRILRIARMFESYLATGNVPGPSQGTQEELFPPEPAQAGQAS